MKRTLYTYWVGQIALAVARGEDLAYEVILYTLWWVESLSLWRGTHLVGSNRSCCGAVRIWKCRSEVSITSVHSKRRLEMSFKSVDQKCRSEVSVGSVDRSIVRKWQLEVLLRSVDQKCRTEVLL